MTIDVESLRQVFRQGARMIATPSATDSNSNKCPNCGRTNTLGDVYCGTCGSSVDPAGRRLRETLESSLGAQLEELVANRLKDKGSVQSEVVEAAKREVRQSIWHFAIARGVGLGIIVFLTFLALSVGLYYQARRDSAAARLDADNFANFAKQERQALERERERRAQIESGQHITANLVL